MNTLTALFEKLNLLIFLPIVTISSTLANINPKDVLNLSGDNIKIFNKNKLIWIGKFKYKNLSLIKGDKLSINNILENVELIKVVNNKIGVLKNNLIIRN